jgi:hypothetical protein
MSIDALTDLAAILRERGGEVSLRWVGWEDCWVACWRYRGAQLVADGADLEETIARLVRRIEEPLPSLLDGAPRDDQRKE